MKPCIVEDVDGDDLTARESGLRGEPQVLLTCTMDPGTIVEQTAAVLLDYEAVGELRDWLDYWLKEHKK